MFDVARRKGNRLSLCLSPCRVFTHYTAFAAFIVGRETTIALCIKIRFDALDQLLSAYCECADCSEEQKG